MEFFFFSRIVSQCIIRIYQNLCWQPWGVDMGESNDVCTWVNRFRKTKYFIKVAWLMIKEDGIKFLVFWFLKIKCSFCDFDLLCYMEGKRVVLEIALFPIGSIIEWHVLSVIERYLWQSVNKYIKKKTKGNHM